MSIMLGKTSVKELRGPWTDFMDKLQGDDGEDWFTAFKKFLRKENPWNDVLTEFLGEGWSYAEMRDSRSAMVALLGDYSKVSLSTDWLQGQLEVDGKYRRMRILADTLHTPLNADHFFDLWNNKEKIPESWKEVKGGITFDGDLLRNSSDCYVLCLYWSVREWCLGINSLSIKFEANRPSAVLVN